MDKNLCQSEGLPIEFVVQKKDNDDYDYDYEVNIMISVSFFKYQFRDMTAFQNMLFPHTKVRHFKN